VSRPENIAVIGAPGSGKSYAMRALLRGEPRLIYVDPMDSARGMGGQRDNEDWTHLARRVETVEAIMRRRTRFRLSFGVGAMTDQERRDAVERVFTLAMQLQRKGAWTTVAVDEIGIVAPRGQEMPELVKALRLGRHKSVRTCLASQRAVDLPPTWRALCEDLMVFSQYERIDLDRLDTIQRGLGEKCARLEKHHYYRWHAGRLEGPCAPVTR
jgi:DNA helicase HerA-like ATPase